MKAAGVALTPTLATLADQINQAHADALAAGQTLLLAAKAAGEALLAVKAQDLSAYGGFRGWVDQHLKVSRSQAYKYIKVAEQWEELSRQRDTLTGVTIEKFLGYVRPAPKVATGDAEAEDAKADSSPGKTLPEKGGEAVLYGFDRTTALRQLRGDRVAYGRTIREARRLWENHCLVVEIERLERELRALRQRHIQASLKAAEEVTAAAEGRKPKRRRR